MTYNKKNQLNRYALLTSFILSAGLYGTTSTAFAAPAAMNLKSDQTPIRSQGNRRSCITFSSTAALEAAYKRAGHGSLDLSEEFFQYMNKTFWLHEWSGQQSKQAADQETQLGFSAGGGGADYLGPVSNGFKIPLESVWPYKTRDYSTSDHPWIGNVYNSPFWNKQKTKSDFNLDGGILKKSHLTAATYYSGTGFNRISTGNKAALVTAIEDQIAARREVVIDMQMKYRIDNAGNRNQRLLAKCTSDCTSNGGAHSMLIVGYDRTSSNPSQHYFIVKNSWGPSHNTTRSDGFTYLSYDMLRDNAYGAAYITGVTNPAPWPELGNVGRWKTNLDGWRGTLDIYHVPGFMRQPWDNRGISMADKRIGTFYDHEGKAYRVNGIMKGRELTFWMDRQNPHLPYDRLQGTKYKMTRIHGEDLIAGSYINPSSKTYGGYMMRKDSAAFTEPAVKRNATPQDLPGKWAMTYGTGAKRTVEFCIASVSSSGQIRGSNSITGSFMTGEGGRHFRLRGINNNNGYIDAYRFSWHANIVTGTSYWDNGRARGGVIMRKLSNTCLNVKDLKKTVDPNILKKPVIKPKDLGRKLN